MDIIEQQTVEIDRLRSALADADRRLGEMEQRKDIAYEERNRVVAGLAWMAIWAMPENGPPRSLGLVPNADAERRLGEANGLAESVAHALSVALPMVKGYAAEHRVGRNEELALWVADRLQDWIDAGYAVRALSNARGSEG